MFAQQQPTPPIVHNQLHHNSFPQQQQQFQVYQQFQQGQAGGMHNTPSFYSQFQTYSTPSTQQNAGLTWNGTAWVSAAPGPQFPGTYSTYTYQQQHLPQQPQSQTAQQPKNPEAYGYYYNEGAKYRIEAARPGISESDRSEALRKAAWADYYASQVYYGQGGPQIQHDQSQPLQIGIAQTGISSQTPVTPKSVLVTKSVDNSSSGRTPVSLNVNANPNTNSSGPLAVASSSVVKSSSSSLLLSKSIQSSSQQPQKVEKAYIASATQKSLKGRSSIKEIKVHSLKREGKRSENSSLSRNDDRKRKARCVSRNDFSRISPSNKASRESPTLDNSEDVLRLPSPPNSESVTSALAMRAARFASKDPKRKKEKNGVNENVSDKFGAYMGMDVIGGRSSSKQLDEHDFEKMTVKGTCQTLEKEYLRLTAPPKARMVRPQPVLEKHLRNLQKMYRKGDRDYVWFCSQFKAMRQDLTVQRLNNAFTVLVYETHARIALEREDLNEYNQCQTQLKELYMGMESSSDASLKRKALENVNEFIAYRIIYYIFLTGNKKYDGGSSDLLNILLSLSAAQKRDHCIAHALKVRVAVAEGDYHSFFRLHITAPLMSGYLMDYMVSPMRVVALQRICKAYRPDISLSFVLNEVGYTDIEMKEGKKWIQDAGFKLTQDGKTLVTTESEIKREMLQKHNSLI